jgi:hypothetical protein
MIKSIVGFGDSWIYGNEIGSDEPGDQYRLDNCILGRIGHNLDLPTVNLGRAGSSLTSMVWEFNRWVTTVDTPSDYLVVVGLTWDSRESWWPTDQTKLTSICPRPWYLESHDHTHNNIIDEWTEYIRHYILYSDHDDLRSMRYWQTVNFLDSYSYKHRIPLVQFNIARPTNTVNVDSLYDANSCMVEKLMQQQQKTGIDLHAPKRHPNVDGAKFLASLITKEIQQRKLI